MKIHLFHRATEGRTIRQAGFQTNELAGSQDENVGSVEVPRIHTAIASVASHSWFRSKAALVALTAAMCLPSLGLVAQAAEPQAPVATLHAVQMKPNTRPAEPCPVFCWQPEDRAGAAKLKGDFPLTSRYDIPGTDTYIDHGEFYAPNHQLFIAHGGVVEVLDVQNGQLREIKDAQTGKVHSIAFDQADGKGFYTNGSSNTVTMFDLQTLQPIKDIKVGTKPDNVLYDSASKQVWVMCNTSQEAMSIDPVSGSVVHTVPLGGKTEMARADGQGHLYVNLPEGNAVAEVNTMNGTLNGTYPVAPAQGPGPMSIDPVHHKLFIAADNNTAVVFDTQSHKVVGSGPVGDADSGQFNAETGKAFFSNNDGSVTVVSGNDQSGYKVDGTFWSLLHAKTMALDTSNGTMYFPALQKTGAVQVGVVVPK